MHKKSPEEPYNLTLYCADTALAISPWTYL